LDAYGDNVEVAENDQGALIAFVVILGALVAIILLFGRPKKKGRRR